MGNLQALLVSLMSMLPNTSSEHPYHGLMLPQLPLESSNSWTSIPEHE